MKVKLKGSKNTQYNIGNRFLQGGLFHELSNEEIKKHGDVIEGTEKTSIEPISPPKKKKGEHQ